MWSSTTEHVLRRSYRLVSARGRSCSETPSCASTPTSSSSRPRGGARVPGRGRHRLLRAVRRVELSVDRRELQERRNGGGPGVGGVAINGGPRRWIVTRRDPLNIVPKVREPGRASSRAFIRRDRPRRRVACPSTTASSTCACRASRPWGRRTRIVFHMDPPHPGADGAELSGWGRRWIMCEQGGTG
jgi:hypothetical protein